MNHTNSLPKLYDVFERVVCLNLRRRPERWGDFQQRLTRTSWPFHEVVRCEAVDGKQTPGPDWLQCGNGAWGCLQSHIRILEDALADDVKSLLILEDDAIPVRNFVRRVSRFFDQLPSDWDAIMLGGQHLVQPQFVNKKVVRVINGNRTHAHALRGRYIQAAYRHLCNYIEHARYPKHHVDHRLGVLHLTGKYNIYAPTSWLFKQAEGTSDICGHQLKERSWDRSARVTPPTSLLQSEAKRYNSDKVPLVIVLGLYRSGCRPVVGILKELGAYLGTVGHDHFEEPRFRELCWNFFTEPTLAELCPSSSRQLLLSDWVRFQRLMAKRDGYSLVAAKHPLAALLSSDLKEISRSNLKFIVVERDFLEAVSALEGMNWGWSKNEATTSQEKLQSAINVLPKNANCLRIDYHNLRSHPREEVQRIINFLGLTPTTNEVEAAIQFVKPLLPTVVAD